MTLSLSHSTIVANYNMGVRERIIFPKSRTTIKSTAFVVLDITITTTAKSDEGRALLAAFDFRSAK